MIFGSDDVGSVINNIKNVNSVLDDYNNAIGKRVYAQKAFNGEIESCSKSFGSYLKSLNGAKASMSGYTASLVSAKLGTIALNVASAALEATITMGLSLAISFLVSKISDLVHYEERAAEKENELREEYVKTANEYKEEANAIDGLLDKYNSIASSTNNYISKEKELLSLQNEIIDKYGEKARGIDLVNSKYSEAIKQIRQLNLEEAKEYVDKADRTNSYKNAKERMSTNYKVTNSASKGFYDTGSAVLTAKGFGGWDFTSESTKILNSLGNIYWDNGKNGYGNVFRVQGTLEEQKKTLEDIVDIYKSQKKYDDDKVKILNDEIESLDTEITQYQTIINQYESAKKRITELDIPEETQKKFDSLIDKAIKLNEQFSNETSSVEKYSIVQDLKDVESELYQLSSGNTELTSIIDSTFSAFSTGISTAIESLGDLRSAWFENLKDFDKTTIANIDKMDKALKAITEGGTLSHGDFWELAEFDTDNIMRDIKLVGNEFKVSEKELVNLKDQYIQKQIESLKVTQAQIKADEEEARQALVLAKKKLTDNSLFDTAKRGSVNLNNPAYRAYLDEVNADIEKAENNVKELGDEWTRNNILIRELNSRLGFSVEQTKALAETYKKNFTDAIDKQIDKVNDRKQALEDEKAVLNEQLEVLEEQQKALEETIEQYKTVSNVIKKAIDEETDALKEQQKAEEDAVQAKIDALKKSRETKEEETELAEKQLAVQEKLRDLEKARNNKVHTYSSDRGWHYAADKEAVANAETAYSDAQKAYDEFIEKRSYESQLKALENEKDLIGKNYEDMIKAYEDYCAEYEKILNEQTDAENEQLANQILGVDWRERIKDRDNNILIKFKTNFNNYNSQLKNLVNNEIATLKNSIKAKEEQINALDKEINAWNKYKNDLENDINEINSKYEDMQNGLDGLEYANDLSLSNIEIRMWDFKEHYKAYMDEAISKARELRDASSEGIDTSAIDEWAAKWEKMMDAINRFREQGIGIQSESDARYYAGEEIISFGGGVTAQKAHSSYITPQQSQQLYNLADSGDLAINVADKILQSIKPSSINSNTNTTMNENRTININDLTIKADNPKQFHDQFEKEMGQYWKIKLTENYVK